MILAVGALLVSCKKEADVTGISVTNANPPRTVYVLGQELDLSKGSITAIIDGESFKVPLNAEGVSVSGYDSSKLGKQTVTVTYKGQTTTFEINVVARVIAEEYENAYFIGDAFDTSKGRLKLTKDDGSVTTVNLNTSAVKVKSFDSSAAGEKEVVLSYTESTGIEHEIKFNVKVYDIGEIAFTGPTKTTYWSHDTEFSLEGGYLTVKANGNDTLTKFVQLTSVEYSGFDPSAATSDHTSTPLVQTVTFKYAGKTFEHKISITYSPITYITNAAKTLAGIDFTKEDLTLTAEQGELAKNAVAEYFNLTPARKNLISQEDIETIVRPAAKYISESFKKEAEKYRDTFELGESGQFILIGKSYDNMKLTLEELSKNDALFNVYADLLRKLDEEFKDTVYTGSTKISDYIVIMTLDDQAFYIDAFECLTELHEIFSKIPANWTTDMLSQYASDINSAVYLINSSGLGGYEYTSVFDIVKNWREKGDCFDIIYSYYCYVATDGHDFIVKNLWLKVPMPNALREWYICFYSALYEAQFIEGNATGSAYLYDTTNFMYYYHETYRLAEEILSGNDQFAKDIFEIIELDRYMEANLRKAAAGYIYQVGSMLPSDEFDAVWEQYLAIIKITMSGALDLDANASEIEAVFDALVSLTPADMFGFVSSLKALYIQSNGTYYAFDYSKAATSKLVACLASYYEYKLPASAKSTFQPMFLAMETYALYKMHGATISADEDFIAAMEKVNTVLAGLSAQDREVFDRLLGKCYNKYLSFYKTLKGQRTPNADAFENRIQELNKTVELFYGVVDFLSGNATNAEKTERLVYLISLYERAEYLYETLLAENNTDLLDVLYTKEYEYLGVKNTVDKSIFNVRKYFVYYMLLFKITEKDENGKEQSRLIWDVYSETTLDEFFKEASYLFEFRFEGKGNITKEQVDAIMEAGRNMSAKDGMLLHGIALNCYYNSLQSFIATSMKKDYKAKYGEADAGTDAFVEEAVALITAMFKAEIAHFGYEQSGKTESTKNTFKERMAEAIELYEKISDTEIRDRYLGTIYEYYLNIYTAIA